MVEEPENLVIRLLQEIRGVLDEHTKLHDEHRRSFAELNKKIDDWQETTATGVGLPAHANHRTQAVERMIEDLSRRVERLERAQ